MQTILLAASRPPLGAIKVCFESQKVFLLQKCLFFHRRHFLSKQKLQPHSSDPVATPTFCPFSTHKTLSAEELNSLNAITVKKQQKIYVSISALYVLFVVIFCLLTLIHLF